MRSCICALVLCVASAGSAQDLERARVVFEEGLEHSQAERWVPALEAFRRSLEITEMPVTLYNIASVLIRLGRMQEAVVTLERYQQVAEPGARADADPLLEQARAAIRSVRATVDPEHTTISIDGNDVPGEGAVRTIRVDPGTHLVRGRAPGYATRELSLASDALELSLDLLPNQALVRVRASEEAARILLDDEPRGAGSAELELDAGEYQLRVELEGFETFSRELELSPGDQIDVEAALSRIEPLWKRAWFWTVVSGAALAIALGVLLAVILPLPSQPDGGTLEWIARP